MLAAKTPALLAGGPAWLTELQGKEIAVTGTIELYEGKPEIVLTAKEDIVSGQVDVPRRCGGGARIVLFQIERLEHSFVGVVGAFH